MKGKFSASFLIMTVFFTVCLISSNLFATKIFSPCAGINLPGAVLIFPISYILNDCIAEVWGYRKARLVIWLAFAMNFFVVLAGRVMVWLPAADFWGGSEHFNYMFDLAPRMAVASLLAFLAGSTLNALVLSRMKVASEGRRFGVRAIVSSVAGECLDSLIFLPIAFWGTPAGTLGMMMLVQVSFKLCYEIAVLPLTGLVVRKVKKLEGTDTFDNGISYNPFRLSDI
ncbi:MAG: queuosine precursor transporter [Bacteroidales bacterium]|nr:queuosine precursor transporter [Bacteroidales bacterium]